MQIDKATIIRAIEANVIIPDGHTIFYVDHYAPFFSEDTLRKWRLVSTFKSDTRSAKGTIFKDGEIVPEVVGVYNLSFVRRLADEIGLTLEWIPNGRGSEAFAWYTAIREWAYGNAIL